MAEIKLFKKTGNYIDKDGTERTAIRFYLLCGDMLIPVDVTYFKNATTGKDDQYGKRKTVLSAFAEVLPDKK